MTAAEELHTTDHPPLRICVIDRASRRNALSLSLCKALRHALTTATPGISVVVVGAAGDTFSSGADLKELAPALVAAAPPPSEAPTLAAIRDLFTAVEDADVAVVAAVEGRCLAGGLELALACDMIVATRAGRFLDAHLAGGLLPAGGATIRLSERVGRSRSFRLLTEGVELTAEEALSWGLVDVVLEDHDQLVKWARQLADRIDGYPPGLFSRVKRELQSSRERRDGPRFAQELSDLNSYLGDQRAEIRERLSRYLPQQADPSSIPPQVGGN